MIHSNSQKFNEINLILKEIKDKGNLLGTIFADRNGNLISENIGIDFSEKHFSSMCASVLESATGLGQTIGNRKVKKIIAELEEETIILLECNEQTFLTLIIKSDSTFNVLVNYLQDYIHRLSSLYYSKLE